MARQRSGKSESYQKFIDEQAITAYSELQSQQSVKKAILGAFIGAIIGFFLMWIMAIGSEITYLLFIPAALVGYCSSRIGKVYERKLAMMSGGIGLITHSLALTLLFEFDPLALITVPLSFLVAMHYGTMKLTEVQEKAIFRHSIGQI